MPQDGRIALRLAGRPVDVRVSSLPTNHGERIVLRLLDKNPDPTETEIRFGLAGNLCRCTGYDKIVRAVQDAAQEMRSTKSKAKAKKRA